MVCCSRRVTPGLDALQNFMKIYSEADAKAAPNADLAYVHQVLSQKSIVLNSPQEFYRLHRSIFNFTKNLDDDRLRGLWRTTLNAINGRTVTRRGSVQFTLDLSKPFQLLSGRTSQLHFEELQTKDKQSVENALPSMLKIDKEGFDEFWQKGFLRGLVTSPEARCLLAKNSATGELEGWAFGTLLDVKVQNRVIKVFHVWSAARKANAIGLDMAKALLENGQKILSELKPEFVTLRILSDQQSLINSYAKLNFKLIESAVKTTYGAEKLCMYQSLHSEGMSKENTSIEGHKQEFANGIDNAIRDFVIGKFGYAYAGLYELLRLLETAFRAIYYRICL